MLHFLWYIWKYICKDAAHKGVSKKKKSNGQEQYGKIEDVLFSSKQDIETIYLQDLVEVVHCLLIKPTKRNSIEYRINYTSNILHKRIRNTHNVAHI